MSHLFMEEKYAQSPRILCLKDSRYITIQQMALLPSFRKESLEVNLVALNGVIILSF